MRRVFLVDDSAAVRTLLSNRLRAEGYDVESFPNAEAAVDRLLEAPPDIVVTDLMMPGLSGVQLCRLLRSDPATTHIPVLLLTASGDKRSRFWARSAGAAAYVGKDRLDELIAVLPDLVSPTVSLPLAPRRSRTLLERVSGVLDEALFESVLAGEVRSLASSGALPQLFEGLSRVLSDVLAYQWLAMLPAASYAPLFVHAHPTESVAAEAGARAAFGLSPEVPPQAGRQPEGHTRPEVPPQAGRRPEGRTRPEVPPQAGRRPEGHTRPEVREASLQLDERVVAGPSGSAPRVADVVLPGHRTPLGRLALAPTARGLSREDDRLFSVLASELAASLAMTVLHEDARRLATTDPLTGLLNRRAFLDSLGRERSRSDRHVMPMSLLLLDVDHFKRINDRHGHAGGDAVLRGVAAALLRVARRSDYVGRWGGEEFVLALPQTGAAGARVAAERLRRSVGRTPHALPDGGETTVTVSIGIASSEAPWTTEALIASADQAMYLAKERGRDRVEAAA